MGQDKPKRRREAGVKGKKLIGPAPGPADTAPGAAPRRRDPPAGATGRARPPGTRQSVVNGSLADPAGPGDLRHRQLMVESKLQDGSDSLHIGSFHGSGSSSGVESGRGICPEPKWEKHPIAGQRPGDARGSLDHETGFRKSWRRRSRPVGICKRNCQENNAAAAIHDCYRIQPTFKFSPTLSCN